MHQLDLLGTTLQPASEAATHPAASTTNAHPAAPPRTPGPAPATPPTTAPPRGDLALLLATPADATALQAHQPHSAAAAPQALNAHQHPQANRQISLAGVAVAYHFALGRRRTIGMTVNAHGLQVRAPRWVTQAQVQQALQVRASWIVDKLQRHANAPAPSQPLACGQTLAVLGRSVQVQAAPAGTAPTRRRATAQLLPSWLAEQSTQAVCIGSRSSLIDDSPILHAHHPSLALHIPLPVQADAAQWQRAILGWLQGLARRHFAARLDHFAPQMGVHWQRLGLTNARTRWGSASSDGSIRLHWRLIQLPPELADYVIVHELAHLHEMNHSPAFWAHVERVMPGYQEHRRTLKQVRLTPLA